MSMKFTNKKHMTRRGIENETTFKLNRKLLAWLIGVLGFFALVKSNRHEHLPEWTVLCGVFQMSTSCSKRRYWLRPIVSVTG